MTRNQKRKKKSSSFTKVSLEKKIKLEARHDWKAKNSK